MKKFIFLLVLALGTMSLQAQGVFKIGPTGSVPIGDAGDVTNFGIGADVYYMFGREDSWVNFGPTVGFRNYFGKDHDLEDVFRFDTNNVQFLPIAGAFRGKIMGLINWGADIGYAVGISEDTDNGFFWRPIVGLDLADFIEINASYEGISQDPNGWGSFTFGLLFEFGK